MKGSRGYWIGVDLGTSGCRAVAIDVHENQIGEAETSIPEPQHLPGGGCEQDPEVWWEATTATLRELGNRLTGRYSVVAICVAATSGTLLLTTPEGRPLGPALMYNDRRARDAAEEIASVAPKTSPARGPSASLAKALHLKRAATRFAHLLALHQADWITGRLSGRFGLSDWNNALKLGFEPASGSWPGWLDQLQLSPLRLPDVVAPGTLIGSIVPSASAATGLSRRALILAGTTDSTAGVIATGISRPGDAVTSLGSTLVVKILAERPIADAEHGVYSHRLGDLWLVGGASNSGCAVLRRFFDEASIRRLSSDVLPETPTGLDYYPLPRPGERFPVNDPGMAPRMTPRPPDDARFLQALFEGIAKIERTSYQLLYRLGAPYPKAVLTVGGGACNPAWLRVRRRMLGLPVEPAPHRQAAYGAAMLARKRGHVFNR